MNIRIDSTIKRNQVSTLYALFKARVDNTPLETAYTYFQEETQTWEEKRWVEIFKQFIHVRSALSAEQLHPGDRIILALPNCIEWVMLEQAAYYLGLVVVALPDSASAANINHIIDDTQAKLVFIPSENYHEAINAHLSSKGHKAKIFILDSKNDKADSKSINQWLEKHTKLVAQNYFQNNTQSLSLDSARIINNKNKAHPHTLATIIYTSGTTGKPKGTMHTHESLLNNAFACLNSVDIKQKDTLLSVTPIAHIMERIAGYYVPMIVGARVSFSNVSHNVLDDLLKTKSTLLVTTPHILDCAFQHLLNEHYFFQKTISQFIDYQNGLSQYKLKFLIWPLLQKLLSRKIKKRFLGDLRQIFCGGSELSGDVLMISKLLGIPILQGYGSSEAGGIVSINPQNQISYTSGNVGTPLNNVTLQIADDSELIIQSNSLMKGYWKNEKLSSEKQLNQENIQRLFTGDLAYIKNSSLYLTGRKSQLIQLTNGKKISPQPMESKLRADRLFKNVLIHGEKRDKLTLICQLCEKSWEDFLEKNKRDNVFNTNEINDSQKKLTLLSIRINTLLKTLPNHSHIDFILPTFTHWNKENGLLNCQGKVNKAHVEKHYAEELNLIYNNIYIR